MGALLPHFGVQRGRRNDESLIEADTGAPGSGNVNGSSTRETAGARRSQSSCSMSELLPICCSFLEVLPLEVIAQVMRQLSPATHHNSRVAFMRTCKRVCKAALLYGLPGPPEGTDLVRAAFNERLQKVPMKRKWETCMISTPAALPRVKLCCEISLLEFSFTVWNERVILLLLQDRDSVDPSGSTHSGNLQGPTFLQLAVQHSSAPVLEALLCHPRLSEKVVYDAFQLACSSGNLRMVQKLLGYVQAGGDDWHQCVKDTWLNGHADVVEMLLFHQGVSDPCGIQ